MLVAAMCLRAVCQHQGRIYLPYGFADYDSPWTDEEKQAIKKAIDSYVPARVDSMFNNWLFTKMDSSLFMARRSTWDHGELGAETAIELAEKIKSYYAK